MLIFTVSAIGTDNQRCRYKCRYSACKINFYLTHAKEHIEMNHSEWFPKWFLNYFYLVSLCLLQCILTIITLTFMKSLSLPAYPLSMN